MKEILMLIEPLRSLSLQGLILGRGWTASLPLTGLLWDERPKRPHSAGMGLEQMRLRNSWTCPWRLVYPNGLPGETLPSIAQLSCCGVGEVTAFRRLHWRLAARSQRGHLQGDLLPTPQDYVGKWVLSFQSLCTAIRVTALCGCCQSCQQDW